jgi:hypothetical protein
MRIALNSGSISGTAMSGIGHYTQALVQGLLHWRDQESLLLLGGSPTLRSSLSLARDD